MSGSTHNLIPYRGLKNVIATPGFDPRSSGFDIYDCLECVRDGVECDGFS